MKTRETVSCINHLLGVGWGGVGGLVLKTENYRSSEKKTALFVQSYIMDVRRDREHNRDRENTTETEREATKVPGSC